MGDATHPCPTNYKFFVNKIRKICYREIYNYETKVETETENEQKGVSHRKIVVLFFIIHES